MLRVILADDHAVVAEGLSTFLQQSFELVACVPDGRALVSAALEFQPDVIVTDISMPLLNGLDAIRKIRKEQPNAKIIVLTMYAEPDLAVQAFRAGARGYVLKNARGEELVRAVEEVAEGKMYLSDALGRDVIELLMDAGRRGLDDDNPLTQRQREILQLVGEGHTMKEVATILGISPRTAESHKYEIMRVLGAKSTADLVHQAIRFRLVPQ